ncbi:MAG: secondary thiamine-phosphate synthase [Planctomycetota bacterium]|nr:MAG: secondary thiamine-phosphate synthase [Planctomycetota bacterium]
MNLIVNQHQFQLNTSGRGCFDISKKIEERVLDSNCQGGTATIFVHHTSASLIICENADPQVLNDLEAWFARAVPDGDPNNLHTAEGPDDMPAHMRTVLTGCSLSIPVINRRLALGTWQGIFLFEHRLQPQLRNISITLLGEPISS